VAFARLKIETLKMKKLFAVLMLIFSVAPACAQEPPASQKSPDPMAEFRVEQIKKALNAIEGKAWYLHHRLYDPQLENGICVENCDGVVEVSRSVPLPVPVPPPPHRSYGNGMVDMLGGAKCITIPPSGCDAIWTAKRHTKRAAYHAPVCR
jgi:hypothetical protein